MGRLGHDFVEKGVLAEEIADEQVLFAFVGEVVSFDLLPWAIGNIPGEHGLCRWRGFVLDGDSALVDVISYICINAWQRHCSVLPVPVSLSIPWWAPCRSARVWLSSSEGM